MQEDLHIDPVGWGWVTGIFAVSYCLFEMPTGALADRTGPRRVLTRIVLWWSAFTALTGATIGYYPLLITRFLFGAGEAGAFPGGSVVISRWFPPAQRATMSGVMLMASQIGGAIAPLLVVPIQIRYGWRASFYVFSVLGVAWAAIWYVWFRDSPAEKAGTARPQERSPANLQVPAAHRFPWRVVFRSRTALALLALAFCYVYVYNFFQTWFHTFLVKGRGFSEESLLLSALPYVVAAVTNIAGGAASDALVNRLGAKNGRRIVGMVALTSAGIFSIAAMATRAQLPTIFFLTLVYASITFQQSGVFGVCLDIGKKNSGALVGLMNTSAQVGGLLGSVVYGYIVSRFGYDAPFIPMAALLFLGALLWCKVDASQELLVEPHREQEAVSV
jgi:MFS family permease